MAKDSVDPYAWFRNTVEHADTYLLRSTVTTFADALMSAEADALCGAAYGERSSERSNSRNGYRERTWDTRTGSIGLAIPKLRTGSYYPDWLLEPSRRGEEARWRSVTSSSANHISAAARPVVLISMATRESSCARRGERARPRGAHRPSR